MSNFLNDVIEGFSKKNKKLSSKYIYDKKGSDIFVEIMELPEYYPTRNEFEILSTQGIDIGKALEFPKKINIIELGAGDGLKTIQLLKSLQSTFEINFLPIDVSKSALDGLISNAQKTTLNVNINPLVGDYFKILEKQKLSDPSLFLFLGANIGNYKEDKCIELLQNIKAKMQVNDKLIVGFDLKKNPLIIRKAYFDSQGVTKRFNLNLLERINRELGGEFDLKQFDFYCSYNPENGEVNSYLVSLIDQEVIITSANQSFTFLKNELIHTELSKKYSKNDIENLANKSGFKVIRNFTDSKDNFSDSMWSIK